MELVHEFTFHATLSETLPVGAVPAGTRAVAVVSGGRAEGERIRGAVVGPGADWAIIGSDGWVHVDVRLQVRTDDGAVLLLTYTGSLELNDAARAALRGGSTNFGDHAFATHLRIECGDERYAWVNRTLFVGEGRLLPGGVEYRVHRLA